MEATLQALVDLLLQAVPTIIFFVILTVFLKAVYFRPIGRILEERRKATEGVRELAQQAFAAADKKQSEFEQALQLARNQIAQDNEKLRRQWADEQTAIVAKARQEAEQRIEQARRDIEQEVNRAQAEMDAKVDALSDQIVTTLVGRRAA